MANPKSIWRHGGASHATAIGVAATGSGFLLAESSWLALAPIAALGFVGLAVASVDVLLLVVIGVRNFTDPAAESGYPGVMSGLNLSGLIGLAVLALAIVRMCLRRNAIPRPVVWLTIGLATWYFIAVYYYGSQSFFTKEIVRLFSIVAIGLIAALLRQQDAFVRVANVVLMATAIPRRGRGVASTGPPHPDRPGDLAISRHVRSSERCFYCVCDLCGTQLLAGGPRETPSISRRARPFRDCAHVDCKHWRICPSHGLIPLACSREPQTDAAG